MPDLLIELFSEEIPARMQAKAASDLKRLVTDGLVEAGLTYASAGAFSTPRRLALTVEGLTAESPMVREERKGPRTDAPEKAVEGFLRSTGLSMDQLERRADKKGEVFFAVIERAGRPAAEIVAEVLDATVRNFPWPKSMRWGSGSLRWVRPLQRILCLMSDEAGAVVVPVEIEGLAASDMTEGHRFLAPTPFQVTSFEDYAAKLKRAFVVLSAEERAEHIWADATSQAFAQGLEVVGDKGLLAEVAGLVEWPVVLIGEIGAAYLDLPPEVLQTSMKEHQKFFSIRNPKTGRIEKFVTVANTETADNGATILAGNQKVLAARLADAKFFWENDLRVAEAEKMQPWLAQLGNVTFHAKLGSQAERIDRIAALAREIAPVVGADPDVAEQAARVAKADLSSEMVYEFPELQGIMGGYYAKAAGLGDEIAVVAQEHYQPLGPSDDVPSAPVSVAVALADKIDTLTGFWAIDEKPTGSKDPFALRRAALGVIRLVLENDLQLRAFDHLRFAADAHPEPTYRGDERYPDARSVEQQLAIVSGSDGKWFVGYGVLDFLFDRLKVYLRDRGIRHDVIDACLAMPGNDDLALLVKRATALQATLATDDGENLIQGFRRANNILTQAEEKDGVEYSYGADLKFAEDPAEKALFAALDTAEAAIAPAMAGQDFETAMHAMAGLRGPIDAFFEAVQVNAESQVLRRNRLNLLHRIRATCGAVADLTRIAE
ncbi:MAG: glycine--tRNA ligase subunit beta [Pseudomonadota bacterium]